MIPTPPEIAQELARSYAYVAIVATGVAAFLTAAILLVEAVVRGFDDTNSGKKP